MVLTCGGFENNQEMIRNYLPGVPYCYTSGSPYNEGDGITMAMSVGADLWHMNNYAGPSMALKVPEVRTTFSMQALHFSKQMPGGMIVVGPDARRFADEKFKTRHGKVPVNGRWLPLATPCPMFMIFDHTLFSSGPFYDKHPSHGWTQIIERYDWSEDNSAELAKGWIARAGSIGSLATTVGLDRKTLAETVGRWNRFAEAKHDAEFGRTLMLSPIVNAPFYAIELSPSMLNTQGGPRRNEKGQIVRPDGTPIPRLYSAGELGSIYSYLYQGPATSANAWRSAASPGATPRRRRRGSRRDPPRNRQWDRVLRSGMIRSSGDRRRRDRSEQLRMTSVWSAPDSLCRCTPMYRWPDTRVVGRHLPGSARKFSPGPGGGTFGHQPSALCSARDLDHCTDASTNYILRAISGRVRSLLPPSNEAPPACGSQPRPCEPHAGVWFSAPDGGHHPRPAGIVHRHQHEVGSGHPHPLALAAPQDPGLDAERDRTASGAHDVGIDADHVAYLDRLEEAQVGDRGGGNPALGPGAC